MAVRSSGPMTYADLEALPDDGLRRELVDGEVYVLASPVTWHQELVLRLAVLFRNHLDAHGGGRVFVAPLDIVFSDTNVTQPDIVFVSEDRLDILEGHGVPHGVPTLLVEILSSDRRHDLVVKRELYLRFGVPEYWVVDPGADQIQVFRGTSESKIFQPGDELASPEIRGLTVDVAALFRP